MIIKQFRDKQMELYRKIEDLKKAQAMSDEGDSLENRAKLIDFDSIDFDAHNFISNVDNKLNDILNGKENQYTDQASEKSKLQPYDQMPLYDNSNKIEKFDSPVIKRKKILSGQDYQEDKYSQYQDYNQEDLHLEYNLNFKNQPIKSNPKFPFNINKTPQNLTKNELNS